MNGVNVYCCDRSPSVESSASLQKVQTNLHQSGHPSSSTGFQRIGLDWQPGSAEADSTCKRSSRLCRRLPVHTDTPESQRGHLRLYYHVYTQCLDEASSQPHPIKSMKFVYVASHHDVTYLLSTQKFCALQLLRERWLRRPCEEPWRVPRSCSRGAHLRGQLRAQHLATFGEKWWLKARRRCANSERSKREGADKLGGACKEAEGMATLSRRSCMSCEFKGSNLSKKL